MFDCVQSCSFLRKLHYRSYFVDMALAFNLGSKCLAVHKSLLQTLVLLTPMSNSHAVPGVNGQVPLCLGNRLPSPLLPSCSDPNTCVYHACTILPQWHNLSGEFVKFFFELSVALRALCVSAWIVVCALVAVHTLASVTVHVFVAVAVHTLASVTVHVFVAVAVRTLASVTVHVFVAVAVHTLASVTVHVFVAVAVHTLASVTVHVFVVVAVHTLASVTVCSLASVAVHVLVSVSVCSLASVAVRALSSAVLCAFA